MFVLFDDSVFIATVKIIIPKIFLAMYK